MKPDFKQVKKYSFFMRLKAIKKALFGKEPVIMTYKELRLIEDKMTNYEGKIQNLKTQLEKYMGEALQKFYRHI